MPEVSLVLSGIASMQSVEDNLSCAGYSGPDILEGEDVAMLGSAARRCRSCEWAVPCTNGCNRIPCQSIWPSAASQYALQLVQGWRRHGMGTPAAPILPICCPAARRQIAGLGG